ncbi:tetratricopeptide repeat protein [Amorphus sp. 3PC139-8]|uniref:tetratricopeptide repeat protein n=1 Tax=Amorphus sp. 3PC139-8 TaxID=2735676 RepID=UPI00345C8054
MTIRLPSVLICVGVLAAAPAFAQSELDQIPQDEERLERAIEAPPEAPPEVEESREVRLDRLFARLKVAKTPEQARQISGTIQRELLRSGSPTTDLLMKEAAAAIESKDLPVALDVLDAVTRLSPDYAEGWNRRATVYFMREEYGRSLADLERTLALEPRHWGAINGLATILRSLDDTEAAAEAYDRALAIYPLQEQIQKARESLHDDVDGEEI